MADNYPALTNVCVKMFGINVDGLPDVVLNGGQSAVDWMNKWTPLARKAMARCIEETGKPPKWFLYERVTENNERISAMDEISSWTEWVMDAGPRLEEKARFDSRRLWSPNAVDDEFARFRHRAAYAFIEKPDAIGGVFVPPADSTLVQLGDQTKLNCMLERNQRGVPLMAKPSAVALAKPYVHPRSLRGKVNVPQIMVDCPNGSDVCEEF